MRATVGEMLAAAAVLREGAERLRQSNAGLQATREFTAQELTASAEKLDGLEDEEPRLAGQADDLRATTKGLKQVAKTEQRALAPSLEQLDALGRLVQEKLVSVEVELGEQGLTVRQQQQDLAETEYHVRYIADTAQQTTGRTSELPTQDS